MSLAHESPYGSSRRERHPIGPESAATAVQVVVAAWLIAFMCVAAIAVLS